MSITEVIEKLRLIATDPEYPINCRVHGLCSLLQDMDPVHDLAGMLYFCLDTWPHYSGDYNFPVPSQSDLDAGSYYLRCDDKWEGNYGDLRRDLCRHFADYLEKTEELLPDSEQPL
jgi:hypothetical protein